MFWIWISYFWAIHHLCPVVLDLEEWVRVVAQSDGEQAGHGGQPVEAVLVELLIERFLFLLTLEQSTMSQRSDHVSEVRSSFSCQPGEFQ